MLDEDKVPRPLTAIAKVVIGALLTITIITGGVIVGEIVETIRVKDKLTALASPAPSSVPTDDVAAVGFDSALNQPGTTETLPSVFTVGPEYLIPMTDQDGLGTCWAFATTFLLESQYRAQGIAKGFLNSTEYLRISTQAYFTFLGRQCLNSPNRPKACYYGGLMEGSSEDGQVEWPYYFAKAWDGKLLTSILPDAVCPYNHVGGADFDYFNCSGLDDALLPGKNPLKWSIKGVVEALDTGSVKRLLVKSGRALGLTQPMSNLVFYPSCADEPWSAEAECLEERTPCPDGPSGTFCYKLSIDARFQDGVFLGETDTRKMSERGGHGMDIVGWNDDFVIHERFQAASGADVPPQLKGIFILHNSWTADRGHSVDYLAGRNTQEIENVLCPNHQSPDNWIPVSQECVERGLESLIESDGQHLNCSGWRNESRIRRVRGAGIARFPDVLKCKATAKGCDSSPGIFYFLAKASPGARDVDVKFLPSGLADVRLIRVNLTTRSVETIHVKRLPFWSLSALFMPQSLVHNNADHCGWWAMPYQTMENSRRINIDSLDSPRAVDIEIEWDDQSFDRSPASDGFDKTLLRASMHVQQPAEFDGPIPFDVIYKDYPL